MVRCKLGQLAEGRPELTGRKWIFSNLPHYMKLTAGCIINKCNTNRLPYVTKTFVSQTTVEFTFFACRQCLNDWLMHMYEVLWTALSTEEEREISSNSERKWMFYVGQQTQQIFAVSMMFVSIGRNVFLLELQSVFYEPAHDADPRKTSSAHDHTVGIYT